MNNNIEITSIDEFLGVKINEVELSPEEFLSKAEDKFKKHFPNGFFYARITNSFGVESMAIYLGLIKDERDCSYGIRENDPMYHVLSFYPKTRSSIRGNDKIEFKSIRSGLSLNPKEGSYLAIHQEKTKPRGATSSLTKLQKNYDRFITNLVKIVKANKHDIHNLDKIDKKYLEVK